MNSDSVNLGSNPSSPATQNIEVSGKTAPGHSGHPGQTAHIRRTEVGTPGPWHYQERSDAYTHIVRGADATFICQLAQDTSGRAEADARLIAAAPDLLKEAHRTVADARALISILEPHGVSLGAAVERLLRIIRENECAIAKATGVIS
jgi:hypothetical protein